MMDADRSDVMLRICMCCKKYEFDVGGIVRCSDTRTGDGWRRVQQQQPRGSQGGSIVQLIQR